MFKYFVFNIHFHIITQKAYNYRMRFFILTWVLLMSPALAAEKINAIVAIVNNQSISRVEVERQIAEIRRQTAGLDQPLSADDYKRQAMESLILRVLQIQQANLLGVNVPQHIFEQRLSALRDDLQVNTDAELAAQVQTRWDMSLPMFYRRLREDLAIEAVFFREVYEKIEVYEEEVEHFLRTESGFVSKREYRLRHLLIANADDAKAQIQNLRKSIVYDGESFVDAVRLYSAAPDAADDGDLQWRTAAQLPAPFVAEAQNLQPGEVSEIITTGRGFHLLQLVEIRGGEVDEKFKRLRLAHIFLSSEQSDVAQDLWQEISAGADFLQLVARHSTDERSVDKGGDLGWFLTGDLPDYFAPVQDFAVGEISEPLISPFGIHLVRVNDSEQVDIESAREQVRGVLRERRALAQQRDWLQQLRNRAYILIIDPEFGDFING